MSTAVHATSVSLDEMRGRLITLDQARERLAESEPLSEIEFDAGTAEMRYGAAWRSGEETAPTSTSLLLPGGTEYQLTKQAVLEVGAAVGIPRKLQLEAPDDALSSFVNAMLATRYEGKQLKLLARNDQALALTRATVSPFSNLRMLETITDQLAQHYGEGEVLVDYKFHHNLEATAMRLIVPGHRRNITGTSVADDTWSIGIDYRNSLTGLRQLDIRGYLFRWWCTNGCTDNLNASGAFSRRGATEEDAVAWAMESVNEVLGGLEPMLDHVQALTTEPIAGDVRDSLEGLFAENGVNSRDRHRIIEEMAENDEMTGYSLLNAVTVTANLPGLDYRAVDRIMGTGGHIVSSQRQRCNLGKLHHVHPEDVVQGEVVSGEAAE